MTTIDKAAQVIADHIAYGVCINPDCIARALARAGLLAPDLAQEVIRLREEAGE